MNYAAMYHEMFIVISLFGIGCMDKLLICMYMYHIQVAGKAWARCIEEIIVALCMLWNS